MITLSLFIILGIGVILAVLGFPGTWLIVLAALGYAQVENFGRPGQNYRVIALLVFLALLAEAFEFIISIVGAKRMAVSNGAIVLSFVGGFVGTLVGSFFLPIFGSSLGLFAGAFLGAFFYELAARLPLDRAIKTAFAVLLSRVLAVFFKTAIALVMVGIVVWKVAHFF